jgi:hypothetical protein
MEVLLAPVPQHQTPHLALSHTVEADIAVGVDVAVEIGTAVVDVLRFSTTEQIALGADLRKVGGAVAFVIGMNVTAIVTWTQTYDPGTALETIVTRLSEICHETLVTREIPATLLTATLAQNSTVRAPWLLSLSPLRRVSRQHHH